MVMEHKPHCPRLRNEDATCIGCFGPQVWVGVDDPVVTHTVAVRWWTQLGVARLLQMGRLKREREGRYRIARDAWTDAGDV